MCPATSCQVWRKTQEILWLPYRRQRQHAASERELDTLPNW
ncbi:MutH/Sau3AI family endonuclease [Rhizobium leguminosarum]